MTFSINFNQWEIHHKEGESMTVLTMPETVAIIAGGILLAVFSFGMGRLSKR